MKKEEVQLIVDLIHVQDKLSSLPGSNLSDADKEQAKYWLGREEEIKRDLVSL